MQSTINLTKGARLLIVLTMAGLLLLFGCANERRPEGILSEQKFSNWLVEMYLAEAKLGIMRSKDSAIKIFQPFEKSMMAKEKISNKMLKDTYRYYLDRPAEFEKIYEIVMDTLSLREKRSEQASKKIR